MLPKHDTKYDTEHDQSGDIRNGKAFSAMHRGKLMFVKPMGKWFRWDGNRWATCTCNEEMEAAKETANKLVDKALQFTITDLDKGNRLLAHARLTQNLPRLEAMIRLASSEQGMVIGNASELDADPWLLGVKNGVVDLRTGTLLAPDPELLITKQCNAKYQPEADCPRFKQFLNEIFENDLEKIAAVQRLLGYTLTGTTDEEVMVICYGQGANGKSVFSNIVSNVIGDYYTIGPNCLLVARDKCDNSVRNDIAKLLGARLISVNELAQGSRLDEQVIKQLAGREPMSARFLADGQSLATYKPPPDCHRRRRRHLASARIDSV
jgi:putative DNA primase/helicase